MPLRYIFLSLTFLGADVSFSQDAIALNVPRPKGTYRVCRDRSAAMELRNKTTSEISLDSFSDSFVEGCVFRQMYLTLLEEEKSIPRGKSIYLKYNPNGKRQCPLDIDGVSIHVPCTAYYQDTSYYRANTTIFGETFNNIIVEIFSEKNIYEQYADAVRINPHRIPDSNRNPNSSGNKSDARP